MITINWIEKVFHLKHEQTKCFISLKCCENVIVPNNDESATLTLLLSFCYKSRRDCSSVSLVIFYFILHLKSRWKKKKIVMNYFLGDRKHPQGLDGPNTTRTPLTPGKDGGPPCNTETNEVIRTADQMQCLVVCAVCVSDVEESSVSPLLRLNCFHES